MKLTKVFYGNKRLKDVVVGATKFEVFKYRLTKFLRKVVIASFLLGMIYGAFHIGRLTTEPRIVEAIKEVTVEVDAKAPIMERIAKCESGNTHYDKNGQVLLRSNNNKSVDVGRYQINSVWFKKATELGLDITKEKDNEIMARWIYSNRGTVDWEASKSCWNK